MEPAKILLIFVFVYFIGLLVISYFTSRNSDNQSFFIGNKKSKWWLVAFGMIGTSLSGVTSVSYTHLDVYKRQFQYSQAKCRRRLTSKFQLKFLEMGSGRMGSKFPHNIRQSCHCVISSTPLFPLRFYLRCCLRAFRSVCGFGHR